MDIIQLPNTEYIITELGFHLGELLSTFQAIKNGCWLSQIPEISFYFQTLPEHTVIENETLKIFHINKHMVLEDQDIAFEQYPLWMPFQEELDETTSIKSGPDGYTLDMSSPTKRNNTWGESHQLAFSRWPSGKRLQPAETAINEVRSDQHERTLTVSSILDECYGILEPAPYEARNPGVLSDPTVFKRSQSLPIPIPKKNKTTLTLGASMRPRNRENIQFINQIPRKEVNRTNSAADTTTRYDKADGMKNRQVVQKKQPFDQSTTRRPTTPVKEPQLFIRPRKIKFAIGSSEEDLKIMADKRLEGEHESIETENGSTP